MKYLKIFIRTLNEDKLIIRRNLIRYRINLKRFEIDRFPNNQRKFGIPESTLFIRFVKRWTKQNLKVKSNFMIGNSSM